MPNKPPPSEQKILVPPDMHELPRIVRRTEVGRSRLFQIEELAMEFSNGVPRTYERLPARGRQAIIVVALDDSNNLQLIKEYAAGMHRYQLTLPKGTSESGESLEQAANRELREEIGFGAKQLTYLRELNLAPGHMGFTIHVILAQDLYPAPLQGDEPEELQLIPWPLAAVEQLYDCEEFDEARAVAALHLAVRRITRGKPFANTATYPAPPDSQQ